MVAIAHFPTAHAAAASRGTVEQTAHPVQPRNGRSWRATALRARWQHSQQRLPLTRQLERA